MYKTFKAATIGETKTKNNWKHYFLSVNSIIKNNNN